MKPIVISHEAYQTFVMAQLKTHYAHGALTLVRKDWPLILKLWMTDLSPLTEKMTPLYADRGPAPRDPASMLRAFLIGLFTHPSKGITEWVDTMYRVPLYAILSGFEPGDVPGVGTFYDFFNRLWAAESKHVTHRIKSKTSRKKPKRGKKGQKAPTATPGRVRRLTEWLLKHLDQKKDLPSDLLFDFFRENILQVSADLGLLGDLDKLSVAGDGTPIATAAYPRSKATCDCRAQGLVGCNHPRLYSQPDCDSGWDSAREKYFNGYHLYTLTASDSPHDLPLYPRLHLASCHDSVGFVVTANEFWQRFSLGTLDRFLLDAAHDALSIYELIDAQRMTPFIDLNQRSKKMIETKCDILISPDGVPVCPIGEMMKPYGFDHSQSRQKWICPMMKNRTTNTCASPCSSAKYGRTFHTHAADNLRLFPKIVRDSEQWKNIYKRRTSVERTYKREKIDYRLEDGRHRSTMMWMVRIYGIMFCQHIDAWYAHREKELQDLIPHIFPAAA